MLQKNNNRIQYLLELGTTKVFQICLEYFTEESIFFTLF